MSGYMGASQFGGNGGGAAGTFNSGFINSQSPNKKMDGTRVESIVPLTVRQLHRCGKSQDDTFEVDGAQVNQVTLVGLITQVDKQETKVVYQIDDGSGLMDVVKWLSKDGEGDGQAEPETHPDFTYIRVFGALRKFDDKMSVLAYDIRKVEDHNEITYHMVEAVSVHKFHTTASVPGAEAGGASAMQDNFASGMAGDAASGVGGGGDSFSGVQDAVNVAVQNAANDETGASVQEILSACTGHPEGDVRGAIQHLVQEGHLYSTVDEDHFKSTLY